MIIPAETTYERAWRFGVLKGLRQIVESQLNRKFGPLSTESEKRLKESPADRLDELADALLDATSLAQLGLADVG